MQEQLTQQTSLVNAKLGLLFGENSDGGRLDNVKIQFYPVGDQAGQDDNQGIKNDNVIPKHQSRTLTGTNLGQYNPSLNTLSATPKADSLMEGDGSIVIIWYGKTNLLDDRDAFITVFGTDKQPIYSTEPVKEGVGLSARSAIENFSARCMFDIFGIPLPVLRWYL